MFKLIFIFILLGLVFSVGLVVEKNKMKCFYLELDSQKMMEMKLRIKPSQPSCNLQITIQSRSQLEEDSPYTNTEYIKSLECSDANNQYLVQKLNVQDHTSITKFKVCLHVILASVPVKVELMLNQKMNPRYHDRDQQLSLVTSVELRTLHEIINGLSHQLVSMEFLQQDMSQVEEKLTNANIQLKQQLKFITFIQVLVILCSGAGWVWILSKAK